MRGPSHCPECGVPDGAFHKFNCQQLAITYRVEPAPNPAPKMGDLAFQLPPEVMQYHHDIRRFVEAMIYKLALHHKKGKWESYGAEKAMELLSGEEKELREALLRGNMVEIMLEAADVANYAMIVSAIVMERGK